MPDHDEHEAKRAAVREGLRQLDRGERIPLADIKAWVASWDTDDELLKPRASSRR
ncbi:hypothetical protein [Azospirillum sp. sgz302134]